MQRALFMAAVALLLAPGCSKPRTAPGAEPKEQSMSKTSQVANATSPIKVDDQTLRKLEQELVKQHGKESLARIRTGLKQVVARWRTSDGSVADLTAFVKAHFLSDEKKLQDTARHLEYALEMLDGHASEVSRELARFQVLNEGPVRPVDGLLAAYSPTAHIIEDLFRSRIAFVALLNFPLTTLEQRLEQGKDWSRARWALARLTERFEHRVPAEVIQHNDRVSADVESYIDGYNVVMDHIELEDGTRPFRIGLKLISHWGLRDEIRGLYQKKDGLARQQLIAQVMERIIRQEIPRAVIDADRLSWDPVRNRVREPDGKWRQAEREPDTRYRKLLDVFGAKRRLDPYYPDAPTHIDRVFKLGREMPRARVRKLFEGVLTSQVARLTAALIRERLGRKLKAFDLWYTGFRPKSKHDETALDRITRQRYPNPKAFEKDLPRILTGLGFDRETAGFLAQRIVVDPARGAGHAYGPKRREDKAHLRTRINKDGMSYKGYNIAIHELGHNVEQVFSMARVDHTLLEGVPNTGFTEAFAFLFQARDLELLGLSTADPQAEALRTLDRFWATFEISGVALLDMDLWDWMYAHPDATPAQLRAATIELAKKLWNRFYAPVFGIEDQVLPAIYSHIIAYGLYTPDYPLGKLITFQVEQHMKGKSLGREMERMCTLGRIAPDVWMHQAVGAPVSEKPLLEAVDRALEAVRR